MSVYELYVTNIEIFDNYGVDRRCNRQLVKKSTVDSRHEEVNSRQ